MNGERVRQSAKADLLQHGRHAGEELLNAGILAMQPIKEIHFLHAQKQGVIAAVERNLIVVCILANPVFHLQKALMIGLLPQKKIV